jgi:hypothetical protein
MESEADLMLVEQDSEACWSLWQEMADRMPGLGVDHRAAAAIAAKPAAHEPAGRSLSASSILEFALDNARVCPMPGAWLQLYEVLTLRGQRRLEPQPPEPLFGRSWVATSPGAKRARLRELVIWARDYGGLRALQEYLLALDEEEWLHEQHSGQN